MTTNASTSPSNRWHHLPAGDVVCLLDAGLKTGLVRESENTAMNQEAPAEKADLNPLGFGQIERGYKVPTVDVLLRIARGLRVYLRDLMAGLYARGTRTPSTPSIRESFLALAGPLQ
jgi:DNA-binding XRE family transcriptional regulator